MPSCSSSSNILSSLTVPTAVQGGSRLIVSIPKINGLTFGNVVRYDVATSGYTWARADDAATSEVFGVIEGLDSSGNNLNVVIYGSISLPSDKLFDMGSGGGCGGNDIYFLSGTTSGALQNLAPSNLSHIIKPVYQVSPHSSYSGVIINYLGYRIGGDIEAVSDDGKGVGEIRLYVGPNTQLDPGFVDASINNELSVSEHSEFYQQIGTRYGYVERITLSQPVNSVAIGTNVFQNASPVGQIRDVDVANKTIDIIKSGNQSAVTLGANNLSINNVNYTPTASSIISVFSPSVNLSYTVQLTGYGGIVDNSTTPIIKIGMKVKPLGVNVTIPTNISTPSLTATVIKYGTNGTDLEEKIAQLEGSSS